MFKIIKKKFEWNKNLAYLNTKKYQISRYPSNIYIIHIDWSCRKYPNIQIYL